MNVDPSGSDASSAAPIIPSVLGSHGACSETTRLVRISSSRLIRVVPSAAASSAPSVGSYSATFRSNGASSSITRRPITDAPMMPTWARYVP